MHSSSLSFVLIILSAISSVNYGFPQNAQPSNTVADVIEVSTIRDASVRLVRTSFPSATPTEERHIEAADTTPLPNPSTSERTDDVTSAVRRIDGDINDQASTNDVNDAGGIGRSVADLIQGAENQNDANYNDNSSAGMAGQDGFPWWSLMLILLATIVIIVAIALPFVLYNRRLNQRRAIIKNSKRASEVIVDSWMAASHSSIPPASSSTSSDSGNENDVEASCEQGVTASQPSMLLTGEDAGNSREHILGAEGGFENVIS